MAFKTGPPQLGSGDRSPCEQNLTPQFVCRQDCLYFRPTVLWFLASQFGHTSDWIRGHSRKEYTAGQREATGGRRVGKPAPRRFFAAPTAPTRGYASPGTNVKPDSFESKMEYTRDAGTTWLSGNRQVFRRPVRTNK